MKIPARADASQLESGYGQFVQTMRTQLPALIGADAARVPPGEVAARYGQWLQAAATASAVISDAALRKSLSEALDSFAAKSPDVDAQVKQYHRATDDLLRWRERTVQSYLHYHAAAWPTLESRLKEASAPVGGSPGLLSNNDNNTIALLDAAPVVIPNLAKQTIGTTATVRNVILQAASDGSQSGATGSAISVLEKRAYSEMDGLPDFQAAATTLQAELGVATGAESSSGGPLTLDAAEALLAIEHGAFDQVGGKIVGLELDGLVPRMAAVTSKIYWLARSRLQPILFNKAPGAMPVPQLVVRVKLEPQWAAGRYLIVVRP